MTKQSIFRKAPQKVNIIGIPVSAVTTGSALTFVAENFEALRGEYICAANVHTTVMARENAAYQKVQCGSVMALPDGKPLAVFGRRKADCPMEKTTGLSFLYHIFSDPRFTGKRHFFYGNTPETLEKMIGRLSSDYPDLNICGWESSVFRDLSDAEVDELASRINDSGADFIWIAIGAPRQEILMHRLQGKVNGLMTGVGGVFNILAGIIPDAPQWVQDAGLEWLFRLIQEPKRLFLRYLVTNTKFICYLLTGK